MKTSSTEVHVIISIYITQVFNSRKLYIRYSYMRFYMNTWKQNKNVYDYRSDGYKPILETTEHLRCFLGLCEGFY